MRSFSIALAAALALVACTQGARIDCTVSDAPGSQLMVRQLDLNTYKLIDSVRTDASGRMRCTVPVKEGEPEFVYIFYKDTRIASLLLQKGDNVKVVTDTLGHASVSGSPESEALASVEASAAAFGAAMAAASGPSELAQTYISHYRECVKYVMEHSHSLTVVPVLFEQLDAATPVFSQYTDAILFRQTADSLEAVYPNSRYVKALQKEASRREDALTMKNMIEGAESMGFPDLELSDVTGIKMRLSQVESKAVLLHFWDSSDADAKMFNLDVLLPVWEKWHDKGLEVYAVDVNPDKSGWASVVKAQKLPWINVNDGLGAVQAVNLYKVQEVPTSFLLVDGNLSSAYINGKAALESELGKVLK